MQWKLRSSTVAKFFSDPKAQKLYRELRVSGEDVETAKKTVEIITGEKEDKGTSIFWYLGRSKREDVFPHYHHRRKF